MIFDLAKNGKVQRPWFWFRPNAFPPPENPFLVLAACDKVCRTEKLTQMSFLTFNIPKR